MVEYAAQTFFVACAMIRVVHVCAEERLQGCVEITVPRSDLPNPADFAGESSLSIRRISGATQRKWSQAGRGSTVASLRPRLPIFYNASINGSISSGLGLSPCALRLVMHPAIQRPYGGPKAIFVTMPVFGGILMGTVATRVLQSCLPEPCTSPPRKNACRRIARTMTNEAVAHATAMESHR